MNKTKNKSSITNILIYSLIFIFILLIIFPPVLRVMYPKKEVNISNTKVKVEALTCKKSMVVNNVTYQASIVSNYNNNKLNKLTFKYYNPLENNPFINEIIYLRDTGLVSEELVNTGINFVITKDEIENVGSNNSLNNYFYLIDEQETNLENGGYKCSRLTA